MNGRIPLFVTAMAFLPACRGDHGGGSTGTSATASAPSAAGDSMQMGPPIADAQLASALDESLSFDPVLRAQPLHVTVAEGTVTLTGTVRTLAGKWRATRLVGGFKGVVAVNDAVLVKSSARSDAEIARDVSDAIKSDPATRSASVEVSASVGTVTLSGTVDSFAQRDLLAEVASRLRGVQAVTLAVAISRVSSRPDAEIATDVIDEIRDDARLDGTHVDVVVHARGAVLSGVVGSLAQREAAVEDTWNGGVASVDAQGVRINWLENVQRRPELRVPIPTDADIASAVRRVFSNDARLGAQLPTVQVDQGIITLSGNVLDFRAQSAADRDARRVSGTRRVQNDTTVLPVKRESDASIQRQVLRGIYDDVAAPDSRDVRATTLNAKVTLQGAVASQEDKKVIEDDVEEVPGVVAIENDLHVPGYMAQTRERSPDSIRHRVIEAIFWDPRIESRKVTVAVDPRGDVTLTGQVDSWPETRAASDDAIRAGAAHVLDYLRVAGGP